MRIARRASLIVGVVMLAAIAVGYATRIGELERTRDLRLANEAEVAAAELAALVDTVSAVAAIGESTDDAADALATAVPDHGVCAISRDSTSCAGDGEPPAAALLDEREQARRTGTSSIEPREAQVSVYERRVTVVADGPLLSILVEVPVDADATVWPTTFLPTTDGTGYFDDGELRQVTVQVPGADDLYVVAAGERDVALPRSEHLVAVLGITVALVLLVLAGVTLVVEHRTLVERASLDRLTQLPNRSEFERLADDVLAAGVTGACLLLFDLDGFKTINDTHGHHVGDEVLKVIARRLRNSVREGDVVARWGGDEFVVLLPGVASSEMGERRARQVAEEVAGRTRIDGVSEVLRVRTSVGVALWPEHGDDLEELVVAADRAMYEAKRSGTVAAVAATATDPMIDPVVVPSIEATGDRSDVDPFVGS